MGTFNGIGSFYRAARAPRACLVELREDALRQLAADARHAREIVHAGRLHATESAEMREQRLPPSCADPGDLLQRRCRARLGPPSAMSLDREAVRFVANLLQQMKSRMVRR